MTLFKVAQSPLDDFNILNITQELPVPLERRRARTEDDAMHWGVVTRKVPRVDLFPQSCPNLQAVRAAY